MLQRSSSLVSRGCRRWCSQPRLAGPQRSPLCQASAGSSRAAAGQQLEVIAPSEPSLQHLAALLASVARPGDCICLYGRVGAGKSAFR